MKVSIYFDVYPWTSSPEEIFPFTKAQSVKLDDSVTRYRVDVEIPDPGQPDAVIHAEAKPMKDGKEGA